VRVAEAELAPETHLVEEVRNPVVELPPTREPVQLQRLADDLTARQARVERRVRVLEDHVQISPVRPQLAPRQVRDVVPVETDRSRGRLDQAQDAVGDGRLPAAGLADQAEHLARRERERDPVDGTDDAPVSRQPAADREVLHQSVDLERGTVSVAARHP
jgi:hypothetical protein